MKNQFKNDRWLNTIAALATAILALGILRAEGQSIQDPPFGRPDAVVDLASRECEKMLGDYITANPEVWNEDIGE